MEKDTLNIPNGAAFNLKNIEDMVKPLLSEVGLAAVNSRKVLYLSDNGYAVRYLGTRKSPERLAELINKYAAAFRVVGILAPPIELSLIDGTSVYLCYLAFTPEAAKIIDQLIETGKSDFVHEGELPNG